MGEIVLCISLLLLLQILRVPAVTSTTTIDRVNLWPMPESVTHGHQTRILSVDFKLSTDGSRYIDKSEILEDGFSRFISVVIGDHVIERNFSSLEDPAFLHGINVVIKSPNYELQYGIDESYKISIPAPGNGPLAFLEAQTVYGALHGLQTFSQLCFFNFTTRVIDIKFSPWDIADQPRFSYRGLLIDTSRHYQSLTVMKSVIESMAYAKLNVLHWHIVDTQSFPLEIFSYPKLWDGAYSLEERYTMDDAAEIVSYAKKRGISVLAEIDVPGHAASWGTGYPSLWPSADCQEPLDVSSEFTFKVINGILSDFSKIFNYKFVHLGGDEVNTSCWRETRHIRAWLKKRKMTESEAYEYFVLRAQRLAISHGFEIVNWEETFNNFGNKLSRKTVVHNWLAADVAEKVVAAGLRCIVSNQDKWYLDHLDTTWQGFYMNEPLTYITNPKEKKLVIGGEVCMWGEQVDGSDIQQTIWPRAAAAAERLWTRYDNLAKNPEHAKGRLASFRCLLIERGVPAAPLDALGRGSPLEPGSCYRQ